TLTRILFIAPATTYISTLSLHDALPISPSAGASAVVRLTLDQAVALALKQNPTAQIAVLQAAQSEQDKNIARADLLPQTNLGVSSEEHTSELQSRSDLVCRLLLEKKNQV